MDERNGVKSTYLKTAVSSGVLLLLLITGICSLQKTVTIAVDGTRIKDRVFFNQTVEQVLNSNDITLGSMDRVEPSINAVVKNDQLIKITRASTVTVIADGESREILTPPIAIPEAVEKAGIKLGARDIVKTLAVTKTVPDQVIEVVRVKEEQIQEESAIPCGTETVEDNTLEKGLTRTIRAGVDGKAVNTVNIVYHDGQEVERKVIDSETLVEPQNKVLAVGCITAISRGNETINFDRALWVGASAYTYTGRNTATGVKPAVGMVAVDPSVIPLGTRLYVEGYGYAVAADTGGSIKGNRMDLFMEEKQQCLKWGRKTVKVYILD